MLLLVSLVLVLVVTLRRFVSVVVSRLALARPLLVVVPRRTVVSVATRPRRMPLPVPTLVPTVLSSLMSSLLRLCLVARVPPVALRWSSPLVLTVRTVLSR